MGAIPVVGPKTEKQRPVLEGDVPDITRPIEGCPFHSRCRYVLSICREEAPALGEISADSGHLVACHRAGRITLQGFDTSTLDQERSRA